MAKVKTVSISRKIRVKLQPQDFEDCEVEQFRSCNVEFDDDEEFSEDKLEDIKKEMESGMRQDLENDMEYLFKEFFKKKSPHLSTGKTGKSK